jgi:hypothetical protein
MRYVTLFLLLAGLAACTESLEPTAAILPDSPEVQLPEGLLVYIEYVSVEACEHGNGQEGVAITLSQLLDNGQSVRVGSSATDQNGRAFFSDLQEGPFRLRGEYDRGAEEMDVYYEGGKQTVTLRF